MSKQTFCEVRAAVDLESQRNVAVPGLWVQTHVAGEQRMDEITHLVNDLSASVAVAHEELVAASKKTPVTHVPHLTMKRALTLRSCRADQ